MSQKDSQKESQKQNQKENIKDNQKPTSFPPQEQRPQPGKTEKMTPKPQMEPPNYKAAGKLTGKAALITGGDSGIGGAVALLYAREGADVAIVYLNEHEDAKNIQAKVQSYGRKCVLIPGDVGQESFCQQAVERAVSEFGHLDILVNNAAQQFPQETIENITEEQLEKTFRTNIFSQFFMVKAALKHLKPGSTIINTTSVTAYKGSGGLLDYSSTKGAIVAFTRSLSQNLAQKGIRVNGVAPGPIWTPLIPSTFDAKHVAEFGKNVPLGRAGQPYEVATLYVFLASEDSSYISGQVLHPNGGEVVNS